jgi:hypothetical protein
VIDLVPSSAGGTAADYCAVETSNFFCPAETDFSNVWSISFYQEICFWNEKSVWVI